MGSPGTFEALEQLLAPNLLLGFGLAPLVVALFEDFVRFLATLAEVLLGHILFVFRRMALGAGHFGDLVPRLRCLGARRRRQEAYAQKSRDHQSAYNHSSHLCSPLAPPLVIRPERPFPADKGTPSLS